MKIRELFRGDIERPIETVIHVDLSDEAIVAHEIEEYVVTENIREHLEELADVYADTARNPSESTNVWVSGFFGSGKSSFAKTVGYALANPVIEGRTATDRLLARANSHKLEALLNTAHTLAPTIAVFLDLASGRDMLREGESLVLPVYRACSSGSATRPTSCWPSLRSRWRRKIVFRPSRRRCWKRPMAGRGRRSAMWRWPRTTRAGRCTSSTRRTSRARTRGPRRPPRPTSTTTGSPTALWNCSAAAATERRASSSSSTRSGSTSLEASSGCSICRAWPRRSRRSEGRSGSW